MRNLYSSNTRRVGFIHLSEIPYINLFTSTRSSVRGISSIKQPFALKLNTSPYYAPIEQVAEPLVGTVERRLASSPGVSRASWER